MKVETATWILVVMMALTGLLALAAAVMGWQWFFNSAGARALTGRMSVGRARLLYGAVGLGATAMSVYLITTLL